MAEASTQRHRDTEVAGRARPATADSRARTPAAPHDGRAASTRPPWLRVKLGEVCEEIHERIASSEIAVDTYVTTDNMLKNCAGVSVAEYVPDGVGLVRYEKGDVLLANIRPYLKKLWRATHDGGCSSDVVVFRSRLKELSPEYLFAALSQDRFFDYVMLKPRGTKMPRGDRDWMKDFEFPLPPLPVQREIVARLERELEAVDELAKKFDELEQTAEAEFKVELAEEMGQLGQMGQLGRDAAGADIPGVADVPLTPTRWAKLGEVCETCLGKMLDKAKNKGTPRPYLRNVNVRWFDFELADLLEMPFESDEVERYSLRKGDIAMCEGGEPGRCAIWRGKDDTMMIQKAIHRIRPGRACLAEYLVYVFNNSAVNGSLSELFTGTTIKHLTGQVLKQFVIPLPPLPTQRAIVARLDAAKARKEALVSAAKRGREAAALWCKAILKEAFE